MATIADFRIHGFDVSSYQPAGPNFRQGDRQFGIWKATESTSYFDPHFKQNREVAHALGLTAMGMYHFARPAKNSAEAEAHYFLDHVRTPAVGEFAVLDYEVGVWNQGWINTWGRIVRDAGWKTVLYTYLGMLGPFDHGIFDLWVAAYGSRAPALAWTFWQHTDGQSSIPGNDGSWDCSVFKSNDLAVLEAWATGSASPALSPAPSLQETEPMIVPPNQPVMVPTKGARRGFISAELHGGDPINIILRVGKALDNWRDPFDDKNDGHRPVTSGVWEFGIKPDDSFISVTNLDEHGRAVTIDTAP